MRIYHKYNNSQYVSYITNKQTKYFNDMNPNIIIIYH